MEQEKKTKILKAAIQRAAELYRTDGRPLPWRESNDPYPVWLSEIMLQQTRVEAVIPYYTRFLSVFPTVEALSQAEDDLLFKCWEGLGYYSRARNLKKAAVTVMEKHGGVFPSTTEALRSLAGIGDYTAAAIGSISFGLPTPAIDGNLLRIYTRLLADERDITLSSFKAKVKEELAVHYPTGKEAGEVTQGFMELGQRFCLPHGVPHCDACPLYDICAAGKAGTYKKYPYKPKKKDRRVVHKTVFLLVLPDGRLVLRRRPSRGLLAGLWEFPSVDLFLDDEEIPTAVRKMGLHPTGSAYATEGVHVFTHLEWHMKGYFVFCTDLLPPGFVAVTPKDTEEHYPIPSAFRVFKALLFDTSGGISHG